MAVKTCRQMLDGISNFLSNPDVPDLEKQHLWDVLSALRGPDSGRDEYKEASTCLIRYHALGNILNNFTWSINKDMAHLVTIRKKMSKSRYDNYNYSISDRDEHFIVHSMNAFRALGLKWDKLNKVKN